MELAKLKAEGAPFPLCRLPYFPLKDIINQLDISIVVYLTMTSSKFLRTVQKAQYNIDHLEFHLSNWAKRTTCFDGNKFLMHVEAYCDCDDSRQSYCWKNGKLNGEPVKIVFDKRNDIKVRSENPNLKTELLEKITMHLLGILNVTKIDIDYRASFDFKTLFLWKLNKKIRKLKVYGRDREPFELPADELDYILRNVTSEEFLLRIQGPDNMYQGPIRGRTVLIETPPCQTSPSWLDFNSITIDSETVLIHIYLEVPFNYPGLNRLIKEWMAGKNEKLTDLNFHSTCCNADDSQLFEGLNDVESSVSENSFPNRNFIHHLRKLGTLRDIKRTTDGRIATIATSQYRVGLYIWH